jgi:2'-5' RNA ligase
MNVPKSHRTALVVVPPEDVWEPIQAIRRNHDRQVHRWMPHVTLVYPFLPPSHFERLAPALADACSGIEPFDVSLASFRFFTHGRRSFTIWLAPEPPSPFGRLQSALERVVPECSDQLHHAGGFTPHLSVGQVHDRTTLDHLINELGATWQPLRFTVTSVALISRTVTGPFTVTLTFPLAAASDSQPRP